MMWGTITVSDLGREGEGNRIRLVQYGRGLDKEFGAVNSFALKCEGVPFIPVKMIVWEELVEGGEAELQVCLRAPVSIDEGFGDGEGQEAFAGGSKFGSCGGELRVNDELIKLGW
jgi:hypothetical protein